MSHSLRLAILVVLPAAALGPPPGDAQTLGPAGATVTSAASEPTSVPGEILVKFRDAADANDVAAHGRISSARRPGLASLLARHGLQRGRRLFPRTSYRRLDRVVKMSSDRLAREPERLREVLAALRARPEVEYAEPNVRLHALWVPNDPYFGSSGAWGQDFGDLWGLGRIQASLAWDRSLGSGVVVAVLDTGVDLTHPELAGRLWQNPGELGFDELGRDKRMNAQDDDGNGFVDDWQGWDFTFPDGGFPEPTDYHGHGTHVAGTIAAAGDNAAGVIGVAPLAHHMPVKVLDSGGGGTLEWISAGILYAADNGARVINASLGGSGETPQTLVDAIAYAHDAKGVVFVAAAGNSSVDVGPSWTGSFPANVREAIAVAASDHLDARAPFSNVGLKVDVAAPGGGDADPSGTIDEPGRSILSLKAAYAGDGMTGSGSLVVGEQYLRQAGTSMAAPHVAGVAALVLALHPEYSPEQVRQAIRRGADDVGAPGFDVESGWGRLNADGATSGPAVLGVHLAGPARPFPAGVPPAVRGSVSGPDLLDWTLEFGPGQEPVAWTPIASGNAEVASGAIAEWPTSDVFDGTYTLRLTARKASGEPYEDRMPVLVESVTIASPAPGTTAYRAGETVTIEGTVAPAGFAGYWISVKGERSGVLPSPKITLPNDGLQPVVSGTLGAWDTTGVPADHYEVCVRSYGPQFLSECTRVLVDPALHPGWPRNLAATVSGGLAFLAVDHLTAADLDGNGAAELLVAYGSSVRVIGSDGNDLAGWPQSVEQWGYGFIQFGPAVGDLTGDGVPEVVAMDNWGNVFAWSADGTSLPGWPRALGSLGHVAIDDLDGDARSEIVLAGSEVVVVDASGAARPGWPVKPGPSLLSAPAFADLDGDGRKEVVVQGVWGPSPIFAYRADGSPLPGWPREVNPSLGTNQQVFSDPVLADLDGDGAAEVLAGSVDGWLHALRSDGSPLPGWPVYTRAAPVNSPAVGDIDGDGQPEVIAGTHRSLDDATPLNLLYAWRPDGSLLPGWPVQVSDAFWRSFGFGAPALADLDGDGKPDVIASSDAAYFTPFALHAYRFDGTRVGDFPRPTLAVGAWPTNAVAVADLDGDGAREVAWVDLSANLYVWDQPAPAEAPAPWPMFRHDAAHTGSAAPAQVRLNLRVGGVDGGRGAVQLPNGSCDNLAGPDATCVFPFAPGETVTLAAVPAPGDHLREWGGACSGAGPTCVLALSDYRSVTATFGANLPPTASAGGPYSGYRNVPVTFDGTASSDPDGDALTYQWSFGDGATGTGATPAHAYATLGTYTATLVVSDGALDSAPATTAVQVVNRAPVAVPGGPYAGNNATALVIEFDGSASYDPDSDPLTSYTWKFGDGATGSGPRPTHAYAREGNYTASLTVSDGLTSSPAATVSVTIADVLPPAPVTDLAARWFGYGSVILRWTATGGNGTRDRASYYDLRYSTSPIDASNFPTAKRASAPTPPGLPGSAETQIVYDLTPGTTYYFALDAWDPFGNHSGLSNVAVAVPAPVATAFSDDMESGISGWTTSGSDGVGGGSLWHLSTHRAHSPTTAFYYGREDRLSYDTGGRNQGSLTSPPIDLTGAKGSRLAFRYFLQKEQSAGYDIAKVLVSREDGLSWVQLGANLLAAAAFTEAAYDLSAYDGQRVKVRFFFDTIDSVLNGYEGFVVDDVGVLADSNVAPPTARPGGPYAAYKRQSVAFDGSASTSPRGEPLEYSWQFGDGTSGTGATPSHAYAAAGTFTVTLVVRDGTASSPPASTTAVITNRAPTAVAGGPYSGDRGTPIPFDGGGSSDPDGDPLAYTWSFGDGTTGAGPSPSHAYSTAGTFNVSLTVHDGTVASPASTTTAVVVDVTPPAAVSDLVATATDGRTVVLAWTATGDDGTLGKAAAYDLRYATAPIDEAGFAAAHPVSVPAPKAAGAAESTTIRDLEPQTTYSFAVKVRDAAGNWSPLSNVAAATTLPEATLFVDDVEALGAGWTVAGTNGAGGPALWHVTTHRFSSPTHAFYYGLDATHNYDTGKANQGTLTSPPIALAGARSPALTLKYLLQKETYEAYDKAIVLVSQDDGATWTVLARPANAATMTPLSLSLLAYQGRTIRIRFSFDTVDAVANRYEGWVIDDIRVSGVPAP